MVGDRRLEMLALYELGHDIPVQRGQPISYYTSNLENGLRIAESLGDRASEANMLSHLAILAANRLRLDEALDRGLRGVAAGRMAADDHAVASGLDGLKTVYLSLGNISALTGVLAELIPLLRRLRDPFLIQWAEFENAFPAIAAADWTAAAAAIRSAIEINGTAGYPHCAAWYVAHQGWLARLCGRIEEAVGLGHQAVELTEQHEVTWWQASACAMLGDTVLLAGDRAEAFRTGAGMGWHEQDADVFDGCEKFFRPGYIANLIPSGIPALDGVEDRLRSGATVTDIGCGLGASTILLAEEYPESRFTGSDYHDQSIELARKRAGEAGVADRVNFEVSSASTFSGTGYDLAATFDCLHDMGDPLGAARHIRQALKPDSTWLIVEPYATDDAAGNMNPVGRVYYNASTLLCVPNALSQPGGYALGAQAGEAAIRQVVTDAGFTRFRRATETPFNLVYEVRP